MKRTSVVRTVGTWARRSARAGLWLAVAAGCAGASPDEPERRDAHTLAQWTRALQPGGEPVDGPRRIEVRFNPAPCECPPWEARIGDLWTRAALIADGGELEAAALEALTREAESALDRPVAAAAGPPPAYWVWAELDTSLYLVPTLNLPVFKLEFLAWPPPPALGQ